MVFVLNLKFKKRYFQSVAYNLLIVYCVLYRIIIIIIPIIIEITIQEILTLYKRLINMPSRLLKYT